MERGQIAFVTHCLVAHELRYAQSIQSIASAAQRWGALAQRCPQSRYGVVKTGEKRLTLLQGVIPE